MPKILGLRFFAVLSVLWLGTIMAGVASLNQYVATQGKKGAVVIVWPGDSLLPRADDRYTAVMFLHPECPCSKASLAELGVFMARARERARIVVVFSRPAGWSDQSVKGALWRRAEQLDGVIPLIDEQSREASRFGALTSGHFFLFSPAGEAVFEGGITRGRGHYGDNSGLSAAVNLVLGKSEKEQAARVYGCGL